ncbi:MAG: hypothetical protein M1358_15695 [Chloroflexi bacterium]|nr:hypothetical protein [Chloroflexota bacterium]
MEDESAVSFRPPAPSDELRPETASVEAAASWPGPASGAAKVERAAQTDFGDTLWSFFAGTIIAALLILLLVTNLKVERVAGSDLAILPLPFGNEISLELGLAGGHLIWRGANGSAWEITGW